MAGHCRAFLNLAVEIINSMDILITWMAIVNRFMYTEVSTINGTAKLTNEIAHTSGPGADTGFHHGGGGFLASLLSLPAGGPGVLPRKILKFYIAVGEF